MAYHVNFPDDDPLHAGFQYHTVAQNPVLAEADATWSSTATCPGSPL